MHVIKVAVVEDNHVIRNGLKAILETTDGFNCSGIYNTAEEAIATMAEMVPDVILMDINLPGMSGIDCIRILKDKFPSALFLMFTVYDDDDKVFNALKAGASGYILKSTQPANILQAIRELYEGGSPMSAQIARKVVGLLRNEGETNAVVEVLTDREKDVLSLLSKGFLYKEIADRLNISIGTVKQHIHKIYDKLHVQNRTEAINKIYPKGIGS